MCKNAFFILAMLGNMFLATAHAHESLPKHFLDTTEEMSAVHLASPFDFSLLLSGNFGELRSDHFHGGIDFKTQGTIGHPISALAHGYIARASVTHGSGYVLDIHYDNGLTSICRHLSRFLPEIQDTIRSQQYKDETWLVSIPFSRHQYPVDAGDVVGYSGNTGYSWAPHLHLDLFDNKTGDQIDPLPYFADRLKDSKAPELIEMRIDPLYNYGVVDDQQRAWGKVGIALKAFDRMDKTSNIYGVYKVQVEVDGKQVYAHVIDRFNHEENAQFAQWAPDNYIHCYVPDEVHMRMLHPDKQRGYISIDEARPYVVKIKLTDRYGNTRTYRRTIIGKAQEVPYDFKHAWSPWARMVDMPLQTLVAGGVNSVSVDAVSAFYNPSIRDSILAAQLAIDTIPPRVYPVGASTWGKCGRIVFKAKEIPAFYRGEIDGKFALFGMENAIRKKIICRLDAHRIQKGQLHHLRFVASDQAGNKVVIERRFRW